MSQQHAESLAVDMRNTSPHLNMKTMQAAAMSGQQFVATPDKLANIAKQLSLVSHSLAASKFFFKKNI